VRLKHEQWSDEVFLLFITTVSDVAGGGGGGGGLHQILSTLTNSENLECSGELIAQHETTEECSL